MATPPVAPPPVAAPAAAAPVAAPAPVSTPQAPPAAPPAAPAAGAPPAPPATQPAAPQGPQPPPKLNPSDFRDAVDSYQAEINYRQQLAEFKTANPDVQIDDDSPWIKDQPAAAPGEEAAPAAEAAPEAAPEVAPAEGEAKPAAEDAEPFSMADDAPITPQMVNDLLKGDEALKAAIEANPAAKGAIMRLAREHAELSQFRGIFSSAAAATFARDKANRMVMLSAQVQAGAESPEKMGAAFDNFAQEFAVMGADGKQVVDEHGSPVFADDFYAFNEHIVDRYINGTLPDVEARIAANQYPDDAARERDQDLKLALDIIKGDIHPQSGPKADPDLSHLDEKTRGEVQARLDEAKRIEAANAEKEQGAGKRNREQVRTEGTKKFYADAGKRTFDQVKQIIEKLRAAGATIPQWQLDAKVPGQNYSAFDNEVGNAIEAYIKADPFLANQQLELEYAYLSNPTPENHQARITAFDGILQTKDHTGKSLLNRTVTKLVRQFGTQVQDGAAAAAAPEAPTASREPAQGGPVRPKAMTPDDAYRLAEQQLAKEVDGWQNMGQAERLSYTLGRQRQLLAAKR